MRCACPPANDNLLAWSTAGNAGNAGNAGDTGDAQGKAPRFEMFALFAAAGLVFGGLLASVLNTPWAGAPRPGAARQPGTAAACRSISDIVERDECARTALRERLLRYHDRRVDRPISA